MCNLYRMESAPDAIASLVRELGATLTFPEGIPNVSPGDVAITDTAPILRAARSAPADSTGPALELVARRWSWPNSHGKPLFNLRGEGRRFPPAERCVALADGFYEFTTPEQAPGAPKPKRKDRWLFTWSAGEGAGKGAPPPWFGIAAIFRNDPKVGEAFTLLTSEPGPDVAPLHHRQIVLLSPAECLQWLDPKTDAPSMLHPKPGGTLNVARA